MSLYKKFMSIIFGILLIIYLFINFYVVEKFQTQMIQKVPESSIDTIYSTIQQYGKRVLSKEITEDQAKKEVLQLIQNTRLKDGSYFWVHDLKNTMILHPIKKELNGKDISEIKDSNGNKIFSEMTALVKKNTEGSYNYLWPKPNEKKPKEKTSYLKLYSPWGWIIGSGMYVEDVKSTMEGFTWQIRIILLLIFIFSILIGHLFAEKIVKKFILLSNKVELTSLHLVKMSDFLNSAVEELSNISTEQSAAVEESASSINEIESMASQNNSNSDHAVLKSEQTKKLVFDGKSAMENLESSLGHIEDNNRDIIKQIEMNKENFSEIALAVNEIRSKTKIIDDIVFQTKLLSFNASVEAARAGEQGKGFSVVAEEIRNLAILSGAASQDISNIISQSTDKINKIISDSESNVDSMMKKTKDVADKGLENSKNALGIFNTMVGDIEDITNIISSMGTSSKEQGTGIKEINLAVSQLSQTALLNMQSSGSIKLEVGNLMEITNTIKESVFVLNKEIRG